MAWLRNTGLGCLGLDLLAYALRLKNGLRLGLKVTMANPRCRPNVDLEAELRPKFYLDAEALAKADVTRPRPKFCY